LDYRNNQLDRYNSSNLSLYIITFKRKNKAVTRVPLARRYFAALALENSQHSKEILDDEGKETIFSTRAARLKRGPGCTVIHINYI
jgi:hypothetical protein